MYVESVWSNYIHMMQKVLMLLDYSLYCTDVIRNVMRCASGSADKLRYRCTLTSDSIVHMPQHQVQVGHKLEQRSIVKSSYYII